MYMAGYQKKEKVVIAQPDTKRADALQAIQDVLYYLPSRLDGPVTTYTPGFPEFCQIARLYEPLS